MKHLMNEVNQPLGDPHEDDDENSDNGTFNEDEIDGEEVCENCGVSLDNCECDLWEEEEVNDDEDIDADSE